MDLKTAKPFKTYEEQIELLKSRGLTIKDECFARHVLQYMSYYDLINGYKNVLMPNDKFIRGVTIEYLYQLYIIDKRFQSLSIKYSMIIENICKTNLAYILSEDFGIEQLQYLDQRNYKSAASDLLFTDDIQDKISNLTSNENLGNPCKHYKKKYNDIPPWILFKNIPFSIATNFVKFLKRPQKEKFVNALLVRARELGFQSTNLDLIYGLPLQNVESFMFTLNKVIELNPDRLSIFNYAHLPSRFAGQAKIKEDQLPPPETKLEILQKTIETLGNAGYKFIGMDHFAKPDDELAIAQEKGILHRNFQGYTTQEECDLLGLGVSAISLLGDTYAQNQKELKHYYHDVENSGIALHKGLAMTEEDCLRRDVIKQLICNFKLDFAPIEKQYNIDFKKHFAEDLQLLKPLLEDGLISETETGLQVSPKGRLLIRNICLCFDTYSRAAAKRQQFSRII